MKNIIAGSFVGVAIALIGSYLIGFSSAIAVPKEVSEILSGSMFIIWEVAVTQFLGYGVVSLLLMFIAVSLLKLNPWLSALTAIIVCEVMLFSIYPNNYTVYIPHIFVLSLSAFLGGVFVSKK